MILDSKLKFTTHIEEKLKKARQELGVMKWIKKWVTIETLEQYYKSWVRPHLEYGDLVYDRANR